MGGPKKIFVGSLPSGITEGVIAQEFGKYGIVEEIFVKPNCEPGRQWAFVTFQTHDQAQMAKESCDRVLTFPGSERPCDVMLAKNQGMFGQDETGATADSRPPSASQIAPKKIFVGSLPDGVQQEPLHSEFSKYGYVEDVYIKPNCEMGRQWAFVTFSSSDQAQYAMEMTNGILSFPGQQKPCEVSLARNQGMFGQDQIAPSPGRPLPGQQIAPLGGPKKIFVGSLPTSITEDQLRGEFGRFGQVTDIFIKTGCADGRNWAFVTFESPDQALNAKHATDRVLQFPGSEMPCEVTIAKHQGMFGQDANGGHGGPQYVQAMNPYAPPQAAGPKKIFVGSLPGDASEMMLRAEFSKYGQITDCFLKMGQEPGRNWAFITFASPDQALYAKDCTDRQLRFPNTEKPCEVMLAKNQGKFGQEAGQGGGMVQHHVPQTVQPPGGKGWGGGGHAQPPPPTAPPPAHLTQWRQYNTASGLPYYHNHQTGVTQWECPPELQVPGQDNVYEPPHQQHYGGGGKGYGGKYGGGKHGGGYAPY